LIVQVPAPRKLIVLPEAAQIPADPAATENRTGLPEPPPLADTV
jgi:hypothetical protein